MTGNVTDVRALYTPIAQVRELKTCMHARVTEGRRELDSYSFNPPGLFRSQGCLHDPFESMLRNTHNYTCIQSVVHGSLEAFLKPAQVVHGRGYGQSVSASTGNYENFQQDNVEFVRTV